MDERFEKVRQMLAAQKKEILQKIGKKKNQIESQGGDFMDVATDNLEYELNYLFEEREREKLQNIDDAFARMKEGTYGECDECGEDIEIDRLLALPFTHLCLDCKSKQERQRKLKVYVATESTTEEL